MIDYTNMDSKTALITGLTGQDGSYLSELLISKGYRVYGLVRGSASNLSPRDGITVLSGDLRDAAAIKEAVERSDPAEVYNLAAQSDVGMSFKYPEETMDTDYRGVGILVDAVMKTKPTARIYQASSSEMFGSTRPPQNETSAFQPISPYGKAKLRAYNRYVVGYRQRYGLHISSGILYNHESPRRGRHYVTRKITSSLARIKCGMQECLELGNMGATRDWGYAGDYVEAMWLMLQQDTPDDYVIATGQTHSVREFVSAAAEAMHMPITFEGFEENEVGKDESGRVILRVNPQFYRPIDVDELRGDATKAREVLGWKPRTTFTELVAMMAASDLSALNHSAS